MIGYNYIDKRDEDENKKLSFVASLMEQVEAFKNSYDEEYLIIIGNGMNSKTKKSEYISFDYRGYLYNHNTKEFDRI